MRTSDDCDRQRRVICQQSPLSYLDVETELLLITDGRSNDPRDFGITIEEMKDLYSKTEINVSLLLRNIHYVIKNHRFRQLVSVVSTSKKSVD